MEFQQKKKSESSFRRNLYSVGTSLALLASACTNRAGNNPLPNLTGCNPFKEDRALLALTPTAQDLSDDDIIGEREEREPRAGSSEDTQAVRNLFSKKIRMENQPFLRSRLGNLPTLDTLHVLKEPNPVVYNLITNDRIGGVSSGVSYYMGILYDENGVPVQDYLQGFVDKNGDIGKPDYPINGFNYNNPPELDELIIVANKIFPLNNSNRTTWAVRNSPSNLIRNSKWYEISHSEESGDAMNSFTLDSQGTWEVHSVLKKVWQAQKDIDLQALCKALY